MAINRQYTDAESQDGDIIYIDVATGEYDAVSNTGGYGAPNIERDDEALIIIMKYKAISGDVEVDAGVYDPETVTQFSFSGRSNEQYEGHYRADIYSVPIKTGSETPDENDFVYDGTGNQLQRWNGSIWVSAENSELEDNAWEHETVDTPHLPNVWLALLNVIRLLNMPGCTSVRRSDLEDARNECFNVLYGAIAKFAENAYSDFQLGIERYISRAVTLRDMTAP